MPRVPVRQWVLSFPIPLRILLAAHPELLTPVLGIVHRASACTPRCAWVAINASNSNDYACQGSPNFPQCGRSNFPTRLRRVVVV
jgi:hypothetical protein